QIQPIQSGAEIKKPGEAMKLTCSSGHTFTSYNINWIQQPPPPPPRPRKGLEWVGCINPSSGGTGYAQAFQGQFTITRDNSITTAYLQLSSLRTHDIAVYYCAQHTH
uniref:Ig-like domain-containing protein n=1 Tax=Pelusios castaneus TaxID=367368 RepID=A0A8C8RYE0_9SAUR